MEKKPTAGIILAAGTSSRLGRPKQLLEINGRMLLAKTVDTTLASQLDHVILVLGHESGRIIAALGERLKDPRISVTINERYRDGMSGSLQQGLLQAGGSFPSIMVILGDQPFLDHGTIDLLLAKFRDSDKDICVPCLKGRHGLPVILSSRFYKDIMSIRGDVGARNIVRENPECVLRVEIENVDCFFDIDSEEDLQRWAFQDLIP
ncbi:putative MobA-related glycosyltransferase [Syntrophobacter sp. SbD1]|nr:putative MobA-related glycosyltransferase [Syntrophobacter sp. SbD1]